MRSGIRRATQTLAEATCLDRRHPVREVADDLRDHAA
jgi:hypothetical protein